MVVNIALLGMGTILAACAQILRSMRVREKSQNAELVAARKIIDEITNEEWLILSKTDQAFNSSLNASESINSALKVLVPHFADLCTVDLLSEDGQRIERNRLFAAEEVAIEFEAHSHPIAKVIADGQSQYLNQISEETLELLTDDRTSMSYLKSLGIKSILVVPIVSMTKILGVFTFALNRSARRYTRMDLDLARQIAIRTSLAVENSRLYHREQTAVKARDRLLSVVAHELKNPLTSIVLASDPCLKNSYEFRMEKVHSASLRINRIVNDLLNVEKFERGVLALSQKPENLKMIISELIQVMFPIAELKKIALIENVPENCPLVHVDYGRILQAVSNVVGNAIKFTPEGGKIEISVKPLEIYTKVIIQDSGPGMSKEGLSNAFNIYWQDQSTSHLGSGLGLYLTKSIVELHGGSIEIQSSLGQGTEVHLTIPNHRPVRSSVERVS